MRIVAVDTLRFAAHANLLMVRLVTDEGLIGLGETFHAPAAVEAELHERLAPSLLGADASDPLRLARLPVPYVGYQGSGAELRARSAIDVACWDLLGQLTGQPLVRLLGGAAHDDLPVYNTCAGPGYVQADEGQAVSNWGLAASGATGRYEDLEAFLTRPGELAQELVDEGFWGMKLWPFDPYAERHGGRHIDPGELAAGVATVAAIRDAVGEDLEVMVELHALWDQPTATRILRALEPFGLRWAEDPVRPDRGEALARIAQRTTVPIAGGETIAGVAAYRRLLDLGAYDVVIVDPTWTGGLSEALGIAAVAASYGLPLALHDCTGPVSLAACTHLSLSQPHALVQETVRAQTRGWYRDLVTGLPPIEGGRIRATDAPGLGLTLDPELAVRPGVYARTSTLPG